MSLEEMFTLVDSIALDNNGCKIWTRGKFPDGYGQVYIPSNRETHVSRFVLSRKLGRKLAQGMCACHTCDNPACVNEDHLWEGTRTQNSEDMVAKGRQPKGENHGMHKNGHLIEGDKNGNYGKGYKHWGKRGPQKFPNQERIYTQGPDHHAYGKRNSGVSVSNAQRNLQRYMAYWGA